MLRQRRSQRGDTIIEVLFAVTVFSLVVVAALSLMNQGSATAERSLEITLVRQEMDSQADTLRFLHDSYVQTYYSGITFNTSDATSTPAEEYYKIIQHVQAVGAKSASNFGSTACDTPPNGSFIMNTRRAILTSGSSIFKNPQTYAHVDYDTTDAVTDSQGVWIEAVRSGTSSDINQSDSGYIDFHIRSCWYAPGVSQPMHLGTIVRLYEPRG